MNRMPTVADFKAIAKAAGLEITFFRGWDNNSRFHANMSPPQTEAEKEAHVRRVYHIVSTGEESPGRWQLHSSDEIPGISTVRKLVHAKGEIPFLRYEIALPT